VGEIFWGWLFGDWDLRLQCVGKFFVGNAAGKFGVGDL